LRKELIEKIKRMTGALDPVPEDAIQIGFGDHVPDFISESLMRFNEFSQKMKQETAK
jgi:hypothetical protein